MKSVQEIQKFYLTKIYPKLGALEKERKILLIQLLLGGGFIYLLGASIVGLLIYNNPDFIIIILLYIWFGGLFTHLAFIFFRSSISGKFQDEFKKTTMNATLQELSTDITYEPTQFIQTNRLKHFNLFKYYNDDYGDDYIKGTFAKYTVEFSQIYMGTKETTSFRGLVFLSKLDVPAELNFSIVDYRFKHNKDQAMGTIKNEFNEWNHYSIYADNRFNTENVINKKLFEFIYTLRESFDQPFSLLVHQKELLLAIEYGENEFIDPTLIKSLKAYQDIVLFTAAMQSFIAMANHIEQEPEALTLVW